MQKIITLILVAALFSGCMSPIGSTNPDSFGLINQEALTVGATGFYEHKETGQRLDRHKCLVYYGPNRIAVDITFIGGRLHRALCYNPKGGIVSDVSVGTGVITKYHANGELNEKRFYNRGVCEKREVYRYGKVWETTEDMAVGNRIPNDGIAVLMQRCQNTKKAVFNAKNGKVLAGIVLSLVVGMAVSKLLQSVNSEDESPPQGNNQPNEEQTTPNNTGVTSTPNNTGAVTTSETPPGGYYRNGAGQIEPMNPSFAGYYTSNTGKTVPIIKSEYAIPGSSYAVSVGNNYLNPETGLMTPIQIQWPIQ